MTTYRTKCWLDTFEISADFAQASCPVAGDEHGRCVADFHHSPEAAMRAALEDAAKMSGDDPEEAAIAADIKAALDDIVVVETGEE